MEQFHLKLERKVENIFVDFSINLGCWLAFLTTFFVTLMFSLPFCGVASSNLTHLPHLRVHYLGRQLHEFLLRNFHWD